VTRVYLHTFGCKANQYDSEVVRQALEEAGAAVVDHPGAATLAVVNSCTVTHVGEARMRGLVRRLARGRPDIRTVVMGCAAAVDDGTIAALPGVAGVVGGADPGRVLRALGLEPVVAAGPLRRFERGSRAWLKIQDGCDEHCTFCATTIARGANRSRLPGDLVEEARQLSEQAAEIVLTGVHIGTYGRDLGDGTTLATLVEALIAGVAGVRFRLSSVEATEVDDRLLALLTDRPDALAPHLHAPLQSGSDRVLKRMGRHWYTADAYRRRIETIAARLEVFGLGADVIVGFPGETEADHAATRTVLSDLPFTYVHVFPYSERPGAPARRLGPPADPEAVRTRAAELRSLVDARAARYRADRHGGRADVVRLAHRGGRFQGLTEDYLDVYLPAMQRHPPARFPARLERRGATLAAHPIGNP
jgi:threonylcarbamoyladenosine tRNA methylthiotransferase MtaB